MRYAFFTTSLDKPHELTNAFAGTVLCRVGLAPDTPPASATQAIHPLDGQGEAMRVWLIEERPNHEPGRLEPVLRQLLTRWGNGLVLVGSGPFSPEKLEAIRASAVDIIVV